MPNTNYCAEYSRKYSELVTLRDEFRAMLRNKEERTSVIEKKEKLAVLLEDFESIFPHKVGVMSFLDDRVWKALEDPFEKSRGTYGGAHRFSHFKHEQDLLKKCLDVNWLFFDETAFNYWFCLFEKNNKFYIAYRPLEEDLWDENNDLEQAASWHNVQKWLANLRVFEFRSKGSAIKYVRRLVNVIDDYYTVHVIGTLDEKAGLDFYNEITGGGSSGK